MTVTAETVGGTRAAEWARRDFDDFYASKFEPLRAQLYAYLGDRSEAQDLVQEAFCRAYARWEVVQDYDDPYSWVRKVAWNLATSRFRRLRTSATYLLKQREEHIEGPSPDRIALVAALAQIPAQLRRAIVLHYLGHLSVAEIARQEDVAEGTVKSWLSRGRSALADLLGDFDAQERASATPPPGTQSVRREVARRKRVRAAVIGVIGVLLAALPVAVFAAARDGSVPTPGESTTPSPSVSQTPVSVLPSVDIPNLTLTLPAFPGSSSCAPASRTFVDHRLGSAQGERMEIGEFGPIRADLDGQPGDEILTSVRCIDDSKHLRLTQLVALKVAPDATVSVLGFVITSADAATVSPLFYDGMISIDDGVVTATVVESAALLGGPACNRQERRFAWRDGAFVQVGGSTGFKGRPRTMAEVDWSDVELILNIGPFAEPGSSTACFKVEDGQATSSDRRLELDGTSRLVSGGEEFTFGLLALTENGVRTQYLFSYDIVQFDLEGFEVLRSGQDGIVSIDKAEVDGSRVRVTVTTGSGTQVRVYQPKRRNLAWQRLS